MLTDGVYLSCTCGVYLFVFRQSSFLIVFGFIFAFLMSVQVESVFAWPAFLLAWLTG